MLQVDHMSVDLLYHVVDAREEVLASLVVPRELFCEGDERSPLKYTMSLVASTAA